MKRSALLYTALGAGAILALAVVFWPRTATERPAEVAQAVAQAPADPSDAPGEEVVNTVEDSAAEPGDAPSASRSLAADVSANGAGDAATATTKEGTSALRKLVVHDSPKPAGESEFTTFEGDALRLADWQGKWVVVNFWATWCAPCRHEMPSLSELQAERGGDDFEVVTIATTRNPPQAMQNFFDEIGVDNLPLHRDPGSTLSREMAVLGLPVTVILNPEGQEVARLTGDAEWNSPEARTALDALMAGG